MHRLHYVTSVFLLKNYPIVCGPPTGIEGDEDIILPAGWTFEDDEERKMTFITDEEGCLVIMSDHIARKSYHTRATIYHRNYFNNSVVAMLKQEDILVWESDDPKVPDDYPFRYITFRLPEDYKMKRCSKYDIYYIYNTEGELVASF